jgi:hypothetical protein
MYLTTGSYVVRAWIENNRELHSAGQIARATKYICILSSTTW